MSTSRRHVLWALAAMLGSAAAGQGLRPRHHLADERGRPDLATLFPPAFGPWRTDPRLTTVFVPADVREALDRLYHQTLDRAYLDAGGQRIMLSVAYGGDQSDATRAHRPERCYPAQGFRIEADHRATLATAARVLPLRRLLARAEGRVEPLSYWIVVGDRIALDGTEQKIAQLRHGLRGQVADGLLVRVSCIDPEPESGWALQDRFIRELASALDAPARERVFGRAEA